MRLLRSGRGVAALILVCIAGLVAAFRGPLSAAIIPKVIGAATGTNVAFSKIQLHATNAEFNGVTVTSRRGQQIAYIPRVYIAYDLHDLLPGSSHHFGLHSLAIYDPQITVVHNPDGTYNLPPEAKKAASKNAASPLNFTARIVNGRVSVTDYTRVDPGSRHLYVDSVNLAASVNTAGVSRYTATLAYREGSRTYPVYGNGTIDVPGGTNVQHWTAARVPLPRIVNYGINNTALHMLGGALTGVNAWYYGKFAASATVTGVKVAMNQLRTPIRNGHGILDVGSDGATTDGFTAELNGLPVAVSGGITDLAHPQLRFLISGHGDISQITKAANQTARLPIHGAVSFAMIAEGTPKTPVVLIALRSPQIDYNGTLLSTPHATVAFDGREADVLSAGLGYHSLALTARGRASLQSGPHAVEMLAGIAGPSAGVPFASDFLAPMNVRGSVLAFGDDPKRIDTRGILQGYGSAQTLAGIFHVNSRGAGTVGPLEIEGPNRSLYAAVAIDHPHNRMSALVDARDYPVAMRGARASMTGDVYAEQQGTLLGMLGSATLHNAQYGKISIDRADAKFGGSVGDVRVPTLDASGSFGTIRAAGTISGTNHVALEGRYSGSLAALSQIAGNVPAGGSVSAPIALVYDGGHAIAQIHDARFSNATVRGVPVNGMSATIGTQGKNVRIYAARAIVANSGHASVSGSLDRGMVLTVANLDVRALRGAGIPLQAGRADVAADVRGPLTSPRLSGSVLLQDGQFNRYPVDAQTAIAYSGDTLNLRDGMVGLGPALVAIDGSVSGVRMGAPIQPAYDLDASMQAADAHALVAIAQPKLAKQDIQGSVDAAVHVGGTGRNLRVNGNLQVPEGSVHGLAFRDLRANLNGTPQDFTVGGGHVAIGTTAVAFDAAAGAGTMRADVRAPHATLADFNDYFDTGDTLGGNGRVALTLDAGAGGLNTGGNVTLHDLRYRRFELGDAAARWSTVGHTIAMNAAVGGSAGRARLSGSVTVPNSSNMTQLAARADANLNATVSNLDLATWLPMLGYTAPVTGTLDADAAVRGRFPDETIAARADIYHGTVGRIPLQLAHVALSATRGRGTISQAQIRIPYLNADGSGTFGLHANDPIDLAMRATSPDVGALMKTASGKPQDVAGALDTTVRVRGTRTNPLLNDTLALTNLRYNKLTIPKIAADIAATRTQVALRNGSIALARGSVSASGVIPITMTPHFALDPANKPVRLALAANNVDLSDFESALPKGTRLAGTLGGGMTVDGTIDNPQLGGRIAVRNGYFVGPIDQNPIQKMNGALVFSGTTVALQALHADVGGGTMDMTASARVPNVRDIRAAAFTARITANGAQFNSPQYFRGKVDADVTASRVPGQPANLTGSVTIPSARIPLTAFWNPHAPQGPKKSLPPVALNVRANVGNDVRVQSSNVDVGAQGSLQVAGTLADPQLQGFFESTGGTVSFFRTFTVEDARVRFNKANGIMPFVNATATTDVSQTYVALNVSGLAPDNMHVAFTSDPSYSEQQIMGLLAGVGGPSGPALAGAGNFSANSAVENLAAGEVNTFFTREMLEPLSAQLGSALGLQNLQLTDDFASGFGVSAAKAFGKHVTVVYSESMGQPQRQSLSIEAHKGRSTAFDLLFYQVQSPTLLAFTQNANMFGFDNGAGAAINQPTLGTNGTSFLYEHKF
ncbi:MAG TPA: translocation/assembly module TamB domain-containing protein [Candidatus Baltobacteraceae bacterium]|jgi:autotransporter translocation and assembly factor TamB|nr:translocation/assembly module TamB domain-containing protein [Candidatus Baltobacteraceae bacterium]